ncbi:YbaK/EbsC family protein [Altererythrobacter sp. SALINAS58]|uniref:YbaK/EbsC family protein n=1 Tax=Alteripontixanthobacter muriae TaxID=2705546 RepID=UPI0015757299|nr:YbaK/EbsC family protein [Alteripontixanthobacter muriae]NTZ43285.1 YbaK/EbsC family protein [Alteripontixanthobacter muriae]
MSLQSVRAFLSAHAPDIEVMETEARTATVQEAADAHEVVPGQIAKTLTLKVQDEIILLVMGGDTKIDNRKYKDRFKQKPRMLAADEVAQWTGHPVGGVCPFGLPHDMRIFVDRTLQRFETVLPAAGAVNAAIRIEPDRLAELVDAQWVDVARD